MDNHIKEYWETQGDAHGSSHWASWGDNWMIDLEIETIGNHIESGDVVLDIGCANGYSTFRQLDERSPKQIVGVDFAESMIASAQVSKSENAKFANAEFKIGDIRSLSFPDHSFDVTYTTRVLINLSTWEEQIAGINECIRVTRPGGKIVFSEGFWEPLCQLNSFRALCNLPPLVEHDFNRYLKIERMKDYLNHLGIQFAVDDFSSIYYLGSRLLRELVTDYENYEGFSNPINEVFFNIEKEYSGGGFGIQQAFILTKNSL